MPYRPEWFDTEKQIIHVDIDGDVTWDQWYVMTAKLIEMMSTVSHPVNIIYDDKVGMPTGNPMPHLKANLTRLMQQRNLGTIVSVGSSHTSRIIKAMVDIMMRAYHIDMSHYGGFVTSLDEALEIVRHSQAQSTVQA